MAAGLARRRSRLQLPYLSAALFPLHWCSAAPPSFSASPDAASVPAPLPQEPAAALGSETGLKVVQECPDLDDANGRWSGSRRAGGRYTLTCAPGFEVQGGNGSRSETMLCPEDLRWTQELRCVNHDDCAALKHGCGAYGVCIDYVGGYDCNCEEGYLRRRSHNGEIVCGDPDGNTCGGHTCGAYGICIDLKSGDSQFDTEANATVATKTTYRCECTEGFYDNGASCARLDCGRLTDALGTWTGSTHFGQEYTLSCPMDSFVWGGALREITISCSAKGVWPSKPVCISPREEALDAEFATFRFWLNVALASLCVISGALAAGLTLGLTTLEPFDLAVKLETRLDQSCTAEEREALAREQGLCRKILPVIRDRHLLLVTLLLFNTVANESLPIFLDQLVPSLVAILLSVTVVLFCGEVFPSAIFTGPNQFAIVSKCIPLVRSLKAIFYVIAKPIALLLDRFIGDEGAEVGPKYSRAELRALLQLHCSDPQHNGSLDPEDGHDHDDHDAHAAKPLSGSEFRMLNGILGLNALQVQQLPFTRLQACAIAGPQERSRAVLNRALKRGARVVLVREGGEEDEEVMAGDVIGCLSVQELVASDDLPLRECCPERPPPLLSPDWSVLDAVRALAADGSSAGLVAECAPRGGGGPVLGVASRGDLLGGIMRRTPAHQSEDVPGKSVLSSSAPRIKTQLTQRYGLDRRQRTELSRSASSAALLPSLDEHAPPRR
eukprot:TRINITY_DN16780_c0_g1_i2.p1 TRINITY_DN16780_c0_g1~~TRINITY_DN16780_c0_g1_i2.p1  ORF type:complete len:725 (+),score=163.96 TRINITY_DN16780_c0_g1_i2:66-2240(+)